MSRERSHIPAEMDLVIGTVRRIDRYGAYVTLDEYDDMEAFLHRKEISLRRLRNIRNHIRENQQKVFKVRRVSLTPLQVDLSLRRVGQSERRQKLISWKRQQKVSRILSSLEAKTGLNEAWIQENIVNPLRQKHGNLYKVFEKISKEKELPSELAGVPAEVQRELITLCHSEIKPRYVAVKGTVTLSSRGSHGAEDIREAAKAATSLSTDEAIVTLKVIGTPRYLLRVEAPDRQVAESTFEKAAQATISKITEKGGVCEIRRAQDAE